MSLFMCLTMTAVSLLLLFIAIIIWCLITIGQFLILRLRKRRVTRKDGFTVGIFHPYCNAGGGGEKVLWCAIRALQEQYTNVDIIVYTGDTNATPQEILHLASQRLNTSLPRPVQFVYLQTRSLVEAWRYPVCTLLGQSLGSIIVGMEAMWLCLPDVYIDTMGYAFTLPLFSWVGGCYVGCYVHYPIITTDMLRRVSKRVEAHNNRPIVARSAVLTSMKLIYYRTFAWLYKIAGRSADVVMVNSSWTKGHIVELWGRKEITRLVYPPCDIEHLVKLEHTESDEVRIVSLGQFRPEKDHPLQIKALQLVKAKVSEDVWSKVKLVVIGSCRNSQDEDRVNSIKELAAELSVNSNVELRVNISFEELTEQFKLGIIGLHTMWNEHFGIGVVECMAAGLVMLAHRSGGPMMDIIDESKDNRTGFLADTVDEYADAIIQIINTSPEQLKNICTTARLSVKRFSLKSFEKGFLAAFSEKLEEKKGK